MPKMKKILLLTVCLTQFALFAQSEAQTRYWVFLQESAVEGSSWSPQSGTPCLSPAAVERRLRQNIPLRSTDFPLSAAALDAVTSTGAKVYRSSRWLRAVSVYATPDQLAQLSQLSVVSAIQPVAKLRQSATESEASEARVHAYDEDGVQAYSYGQSLDQVNQINLIPLHNAGYAGAGINIALMDGGFTGVDVHSAFTGAWSQGRIVLTHDFVDNDTNVFQVGSHGMSVLSTICADLDGTFVGTAPEANYYLFRTEDELSETLVEEDNWVVASEWADSLGVDVINTSLGYTTFDNGIGDHSYADLDGKTTVISKAATAAARTGMIVVVAAGNEGASSWKYISCPADADSILSIGAVDGMDLRAAFSSQGPTSDGRIKPDLGARGVSATIMNWSGQVATGSGTSFASPITCGAMACLLQAVKANQSTYAIQDILTAVRENASQASKPDTMLGWGIPNFSAALTAMGLEEGGPVPTWALQPQDGGYLLRRLRPTGMVTMYRYDATGRLLTREELEPGVGYVYLEGSSEITLLHLVGEEEEVLKVPAF
ncbi:MAG: hypothetical protein RL168_219 [Bacteroidota bacterium]